MVAGRHRASTDNGLWPAVGAVERPLADPGRAGDLAHQGGRQPPRSPGRPVRLRQHRRRLAGPGLAFCPGGPVTAGPAPLAPPHGPGHRRRHGRRHLSHRFAQCLGRPAAGGATGGGAPELALAAAPAAAEPGAGGPGQPARHSGRPATARPRPGAPIDLGPPQRRQLPWPEATGDHPPEPVAGGGGPGGRAALAGLGGGGLQRDLSTAHRLLAWPHPQPAPGSSR